MFPYIQALALPTFDEQNAAEQSVEVIKPSNDEVDAFRAEIERYFVRFLNFYDRTNASLRAYRLLHVALISRIYNALMVVIGDRIEEVRVASYELDDLITAKYEELGGFNECLLNILNTRNVNSASVGTNIQECTVTANTTLSALLSDVFYPVFAAIQTEASTVPISVIDVLSRGNVLEDETAILQYLEDRYTVLDLQWLSIVSQMLRWESNRFENEGLFLNDDTNICLLNATWQFLLTNSYLEGLVQDC